MFTGNNTSVAINYATILSWARNQTY